MLRFTHNSNRATPYRILNRIAPDLFSNHFISLYAFVFFLPLPVLSLPLKAIIGHAGRSASVARSRHPHFYLPGHLFSSPVQVLIEQVFLAKGCAVSSLSARRTTLFTETLHVKQHRKQATYVRVEKVVTTASTTIMYLKAAENKMNNYDWYRCRRPDRVKDNQINHSSTSDNTRT